VGMRKSGLRNLFVIGEVAFSAVLVVLATLLGASFLKIRSQPVGFNSAHAYAFTVELPWDTDSKVVDAAAFEMVSRMNNFPGTIAGGVVDRLPLHGPSQSRLLQVRGKTLSTSISEKEFGFRTANAGYFAAAGIPLVSGAIYRDWPVGKKGVPEAVISQRLAEILFPGENPIGREISDQARGTGAKGKPTWFRIVGEVSSIPARPTDAEPAAELYVPWGATYWPLMNFVIRTERPLADVSRYVHEQTKHLAGADQIPSVTATLDERISETRSTPRSAALLVSGFAAAALALATLGIFGLMAHETARRTQEIGVRLALGAEPRSVAVDSVVRAAKLACVGLAAGLVAAWFASTLLKSLLFGIAPHDVFSYAMAAAMLLAAAMLASLLPALRAAQIDPVRALRHE
jgi:predicted permease